MVGFVHTHPYSGNSSLTPSEADKFVKKLLGMNNTYIVACAIYHSKDGSHDKYYREVRILDGIKYEETIDGVTKIHPLGFLSYNCDYTFWQALENMLKAIPEY